MTTGIRLIAEYYEVESSKIISSKTIIEEQITKATTLRNLGYSHIEQIKIIQEIQNAKIAPQILLNCPVKGFHSRTAEIFESTLKPLPLLGCMYMPTF